MADAEAAVDTDAPNYWDPTDEKYQEDLAEYAVGPIILAILTVVVFAAFLVTRVVCCCCGNGWCPKKGDKATAASFGGVLTNIIICAVPLVAAIIAGSLLAQSGGPVEDVLNNTVDTVLGQVRLVQEEVDNATTTSQRAVEAAGVDIDLSPLVEANQTLSDAIADLDDTEKDVEHYLTFLRTALLSGGLAVIACALVGLGTLAVRRSFCLTPFLVIAFVLTVVCWLAGGLGRVTDTAFEDACDMMARHVAGQQNPWILEQARCAELETGVEALDTAMEAGNAAVTDGNAQINEINEAMESFAAFTSGREPLALLCMPYTNATGEWAVQDNPEEGCTPLTQADLNATYGERVCDVVIPDGTSPQDVPEYQACFLAGDEIPRATYDELLDKLATFDDLNAVLPSLRTLADCSFIDRGFSAVLDNDCGSVNSELTRMFVSSLVGALALAAASLYFCVCFQNIRKQKNDDVPTARAYNDSAHSPAKPTHGGGVPAV